MSGIIFKISLLGSLFTQNTLPEIIYPPIPEAWICEQCYLQAENDLAWINYRCEDPAVCPLTPAQVKDLREETERVKEIWFAAWYLRSPMGYPYQYRDQMMTLSELLGDYTLWRGEIPLPLSLR